MIVIQTARRDELVGQIGGDHPHRWFEDDDFNHRDRVIPMIVPAPSWARWSDPAVPARPARSSTLARTKISQSRSQPCMIKSFSRMAFSLFIDLSPSQNEAVHNLINLHLFPQCILRLGQFDHCEFCDAEVVWERTGNPYASGMDPITYRYSIDGPGFSLCLLAIWSDEDQATADVHVVVMSPDRDEAREALRDWLASIVDAKMPPRDLFRKSRRH